MTRTRRGATAAVLVLLACAPPARAGLITYNATPATGSPAGATVTFDDGATPGSVRVTVAVDHGVCLADLNGFFFNLRDESLLPGLSVTGDVTLSVKNANAVTSAGPGNNVNGGGIGAFDVGVRFGSPGIGKDDVAVGTFLLGDPGVALTNDMFAGAANAQGHVFAVRLTSVGTTESNRTGSSKLVNGDVLLPPVHTPEPSTLVGLLTLCSLALPASRLRGVRRGPASM
jgi:hypothetical protein